MAEVHAGDPEDREAEIFYVLAILVGFSMGAAVAVAAAGIIVCGDIERAHDGQESYMLQDCSAATENLLLAAAALAALATSGNEPIGQSPAAADRRSCQTGPRLQRE